MSRTWDEIAGHIQSIGEEVGGIAIEAAELVGALSPERSAKFSSSDPRSTQLKAAQFAANLNYTAAELQRKAESIEEGVV